MSKKKKIQRPFLIYLYSASTIEQMAQADNTNHKNYDRKPQMCKKLNLSIIDIIYRYSITIINTNTLIHVQ